jgi:hypothetical protein
MTKKQLNGWVPGS